MRRLTVLALLLAACGTAAETTTTTQAGTGAEVTSATTEPAESTATQGGSEGTATTTADECPMEESDRPMAPDFTLALGDGGLYTLSEGCQPVFMVFWAEW